MQRRDAYIALKAAMMVNPFIAVVSAIAAVGAALAAGAAAIVGHSFPVYLGFRGGKGVATSAGALLGIAPLAGVIGLGVWAALFFAFRYVSLASIGAAVAVPVAAWLLYRDKALAIPAALTLLAALVIVRHRDNIRRLLAGTEHRFERKS